MLCFFRTFLLFIFTWNDTLCVCECVRVLKWYYIRAGGAHVYAHTHIRTGNSFSRCDDRSHRRRRRCSVAEAGHGSMLVGNGRVRASTCATAIRCKFFFIHFLTVFLSHSGWTALDGEFCCIFFVFVARRMCTHNWLVFCRREKKARIRFTHLFNDFILLICNVINAFVHNIMLLYVSERTSQKIAY